VHEDTSSGRIIVHENKTGARIDDAWSAGMLMSHQLTGYVVAARIITGHEVEHAIAHGLQIPQPKTGRYGSGVVYDKVVRRDMHVQKWLEWVVDGVTYDSSYNDNVFFAPRFTHSCNRYFRPCPFIPLCDTETREEFNMTLSEMNDDRWTPLDD
ncbi:hypothetical protein HC928_00455, partial [bacterium]|nr:hypothetical protein [bacterium]